MTAQHPSKPFFIDRSLGGHQVADAMCAVGLVPDRHTDEVWPQAAGRSGWLVLSKDKRIASRTLELRAIAHAGAQVFVLGAGDTPRNASVT